ncbi:hypothetical protein FA95DRAFT_1555647 [Auriscalpium vulgare]|uniref:Uncharacterized protein n=1 Tax=Auriscalpium vulgare TaxID=40419 RepID=A0ACB8S3S4_9AGAM|nr:hypothetical protein FA95DRAFT_1555647 [Auriscalpium vulgare]
MPRYRDISDSESVDDYTADPNDFAIRNALESPKAVVYTAEELHLMMHEAEIDLEPVYQRDVVWTTSKQEALINSLFHKYYIPPVVFAVTVDDGEEVRLCVDGKQRLTSIQKFIDGIVRHIADKDPRTKRKWYYTVSPGNKEAGRLEIPSSAKKMFSQLPITCVEYSTLDEVAQRDVFQRVQLGMSLTTAERLQAVSSPRAVWLTDLDKQYMSVDNGLADCIDLDTARGRNFQNLAQIAYCCDGLPEVLVPTTGKVETWLRDMSSPTPKARKRMVDVLTDFWRIATNTNLNHGIKSFKSKFSPVEFVYVGVLIFVTADDFTIDEQADAIFTLRKELRRKHQDLRLNSRVGQDCWSIIDQLSHTADSEWRPQSTRSTRGRRLRRRR